MNRSLAARLTLVACLTVSAVPQPISTSSAADSDDRKIETVTLTGRVVRLTEALRILGLTFDAEPVAKQVVLEGEDGTITPFLSDDASRALFQDERLQKRRAALTGRKHDRLPYFQVVAFQVDDQGRLRTPEYFCDICTISVRYPQICPCCQGDMVLRMRPER
jgi:hypothetical protein